MIISLTICRVFRVLIREVFAGWVLLSLTDVLADPYILNTLIVLATSDEKMAQLPATPNYKVKAKNNKALLIIFNQRNGLI